MCRISLLITILYLRTPGTPPTGTDSVIPFSNKHCVGVVTFQTIKPNIYPKDRRNCKKKHLFALHYTYQCKNTDAEITDAEITDPTNTFDVLIFSQEWPVTVCKYWMSDLNGTNCIFPKKKNQWSVHGIWPIKYGARRDWCNHSWPFDPEQITSIRSDLEQAWIQVYDGYDYYEFWRHEWNKHGTCGTELEPFNSEFKYFSKGIEWNHKYSISDMLAAGNIFPDDTKEWDPEELVDAVKAITNKTAKMGCYCINKVLYVQEIRICFDKQLNLIDCKLPAVDECCRSSKSVVFPANA